MQVGGVGCERDVIWAEESMCIKEKKKIDKPLYNPLNDLKEVVRKTTFKGFSKSFCHYTVKTSTSPVHGFYFRHPKITFIGKNLLPSSIKLRVVKCDLCEHKTPLVLFFVTSPRPCLHSRVNKQGSISWNRGAQKDSSPHLSQREFNETTPLGLQWLLRKLISACVWCHLVQKHKPEWVCCRQQQMKT